MVDNLTQHESCKSCSPFLPLFPTLHQYNIKNGPLKSICFFKKNYLKKLRLEARGNSGGCRRWNADLAAFSDQS
jgi:hypothetical protein